MACPSCVSQKRSDHGSRQPGLAAALPIRTAGRGLPLEELGNVHAQPARDPVEHHDGRVALAALDATQIGLVNAGLVGELFLRKLAFDAKSSDVSADALANIHAGYRAAGLLAGP